MNRYRMMSMEQLFKAYQFENNRINEEDAENTKSCIVKEIYRRIKVSLYFLDSASSGLEAEKIFMQFIIPKFKKSS